MSGKVELHQRLCECLEHAQNYGDWSKLLKLVNGSTSRIKIIQWIEKYSPYAAKIDDNRLLKLYKRGDDFDIEGARLNPYWAFNNPSSSNKSEARLRNKLKQPSLRINNFNVTDKSGPKHRNQAKEDRLDLAFKKFKKHPDEENYYKLRRELEEHRKVLYKKKKKSKIITSVVQGGAYGLGKNRRH